MIAWTPDWIENHFAVNKDDNAAIGLPEVSDLAICEEEVENREPCLEGLCIDHCT